ncbi:hypothetical protein LAZ67_15001025 [Cordylochernes scorpioides]|uniref:Reverse transcriptase domain-containing protein n=1 Tax=Cordylochernes scorpioides TaxID=51811 RepID=A0ABY6L993_9ARAC|nr:hypothetical protein LAZ67_15001025 [Cordylochernes scorpioides]
MVLFLLLYFHGLNFTYADKVLIAYNTEEQHLLGCLREYNLTINETKYTLGQTWVKFLGFVITNAGNWLDLQRVQAIKDIPIPDTLGKTLGMLISTVAVTSTLPEFKSLRLRGLTPEGHHKEPTMLKSEPGETSAQVPSTYISLQQPRCPSPFTGDVSEDSQRWLKDYQRVAKFNRWNDSMCLANVIFFLAGTAR